MKDTYYEYSFKPIGLKIAALRNLHNMSQKTFGDRCGISQSFIGEMEQGNREASLKTLIKITNAFNITLDDLLSDVLVKYNDNKNYDKFDDENLEILAQQLSIMNKTKLKILDEFLFYFSDYKNNYGLYSSDKETNNLL